MDMMKRDRVFLVVCTRAPNTLYQSHALRKFVTEGYRKIEDQRPNDMLVCGVQCVLMVPGQKTLTRGSLCRDEGWFDSRREST